MADNESAQEKTEQATDRQIEKFREEGQIARSQEVPAAVMIAASMIMLPLLGSSFMKVFSNALKGAIMLIPEHNPMLFFAWMKMFGVAVLRPALMFAGLLFAIMLAVSLAQTGLLFSTKALAPRFSSISPMSGLKKIFSPTTLITLVKSLLKLIVIGSIIYHDLRDNTVKLIELSMVPLEDGFAWGIAMITRMVGKILIFLITVAAADYFYQWFSMQKKMRMSKQEIKEEMKDSQVSEHVKGKVRQVANQRARRSIQKEVPQADVIITNPTHYSIAIRYQRGKDQAPRVVAKGKNHMAFLIRKIAQEHKVPLYEYPELARALYSKVKVGKTIPEELYENVARVLAYIYRIYKKRHLIRKQETYA